MFMLNFIKKKKKKEGKQVLTHACRSYRNCVERSHLFD